MFGSGLLVTRMGTVLDDVASNANETSRTYELSLQGATRVRWTAILDHDSATDLQIAVSLSLNDGDNWGLVQSQVIKDGEATLHDYTQMKSTSDDVSIDGFVDCLGATNIKIILSATGGGADDLLSLIVNKVEMV